MQRKQFLNNIDQLLEIAKENKEEGVIHPTDDLFSFMLTFNITPGNENVLKRTLYSLYRSWAEEPSPQQVFSKKLAEYLPMHKIGRLYYFKINKDGLQLQKETLSFFEKKKIDRTKSPAWQKHFESFLEQNAIKPGSRWLQYLVLHHLYQKWCYDNKRKSMLSERTLFNFLKLYFKYRRVGESRMTWFGLNEEFVNSISPQTIKNLNRKGKHNEKKQKAKNKVPSTKART